MGRRGGQEGPPWLCAPFLTSPLSGWPDVPLLEDGAAGPCLRPVRQHPPSAPAPGAAEDVHLENAAQHSRPVEPRCALTPPARAHPCCRCRWCPHAPDGGKPPVPAQPLQALPVIGVQVCVAVEGETLEEGAPGHLPGRWPHLQPRPPEALLQRLRLVRLPCVLRPFRRQRTRPRAKPCASTPHSRYLEKSRSTYRGNPRPTSAASIIRTQTAKTA